MFLPFTTVHGIHILSLCVCVCLCVSEYVFGEIKIYQIREYWLRPHTNWYIWVPHTHTHTHHSFHSLSFLHFSVLGRFLSFFYLIAIKGARLFLQTIFLYLVWWNLHTNKQTIQVINHRCYYSIIWYEWRHATWIWIESNLIDRFFFFIHSIICSTQFVQWVLGCWIVSLNFFLYLFLIRWR